MSTVSSNTTGLDLVIIGGGAAGLWILDEAVRDGRSALLLENTALGAGQTISSQGIIHGGVKYALSGRMNSSAAAIADMPRRWRECLAGTAQPDLSETLLRADHCYLWQTRSLKSRAGMFAARAGLRIAPQPLARDERPEPLRKCPGIVARLDEQVVEPGSFLQTLAVRHHSRILLIDSEMGLHFDLDSSGKLSAINLHSSGVGRSITIAPGCVVFTAGGGNARLRAMAGLSAGMMQRRPLHMTLARGPLPPLNGHCIDGAKTRLTITTPANTSTIWQIGGQVAEDGVKLSPPELIHHVRRELETVLPGIDLAEIEWATYRVDRAEPVAKDNRRPDNAHATREGNIITAWPSKFALVPRLAEQVISLLDDSTVESHETDEVIENWPRPQIAKPPWELIEQWSKEGSAAAS